MGMLPQGLLKTDKQALYASQYTLFLHEPEIQATILRSLIFIRMSSLLCLLFLQGLKIQAQHSLSQLQPIGQITKNQPESNIPQGPLCPDRIFILCKRKPEPAEPDNSDSSTEWWVKSRHCRLTFSFLFLIFFVLHFCTQTYSQILKDCSYHLIPQYLKCNDPFNTFPTILFFSFLLQPFLFYFFLLFPFSLLNLIG